MIEVRSALTAQVLGYVPGSLHWPAQSGRMWNMELDERPGDAMVRRIALPIVEFIDPSISRLSGWAVLNSDGHSLDLLRQIKGWVEADSSPILTRKPELLR